MYILRHHRRAGIYDVYGRNGRGLRWWPWVLPGDTYLGSVLYPEQGRALARSSGYGPAGPEGGTVMAETEQQRKERERRERDRRSGGTVDIPDSGGYDSGSSTTCDSGSSGGSDGGSCGGGGD